VLLAAGRASAQSTQSHCSEQQALQLLADRNFPVLRSMCSTQRPALSTPSATAAEVAANNRVHAHCQSTASLCSLSQSQRLELAQSARAVELATQRIASEQEGRARSAVDTQVCSQREAIQALVARWPNIPRATPTPAQQLVRSELAENLQEVLHYCVQPAPDRDEHWQRLSLVQRVVAPLLVGELLRMTPAARRDENQSAIRNRITKPLPRRGS
jgi:hypothetical protein